MVNPHKILLTLLGASAKCCLRPRRWGSPNSDSSPGRYYSTIPQRRNGPGGLVLSPPSIYILSYIEKTRFSTDKKSVYSLECPE